MNNINQLNNMNVLIPLAGKGSRFRKVGFKNPKPLIMIDNKSMIEHVIRSIKIHAKYYFIIQKCDNIDNCLKNIIENVCSELEFCREHKIIEIDGYTMGASETCLKAKEYINQDEKLIILNCDQIMNWDSTHFINFIKKNDYDGIVVTKKKR